MRAATVGTAAAGIALLRRRGRTVFGEPLHIPRHPVRREAVLGGSMFGVGFGVGATCPGITVSMLATGSAYGLVVLAGILAGLWGRGRVEQRERGAAHVRLSAAIPGWSVGRARRTLNADKAT